MNNRELGTISKKVILFLWGGLALGLSGNPKNYFKILRVMGKEWEDINRKALNRAIKNLYHSKLVDIKEDKEGLITLVLSEDGKKRALKYNLENIRISKMKEWDNKWRIVLFDIPETRKKFREALRSHLKDMEFYEFQKSVFVHPYECKNEIDYLVEFYNIRSYVRLAVAENIDNELHLKKHFKLL